jgi:hypothetical protein
MTFTRDQWLVIVGIIVAALIAVAGWFASEAIHRKNEAANAQATRLHELVAIVATMKDSLQNSHYEQFTTQCRDLHDRIIRGDFKLWLNPSGRIIPTTTSGELEILSRSVDSYLSDVDRYNSRPPSDCRESMQRDVADVLRPVIEEVGMILMWKESGAVE